MTPELAYEKRYAAVDNGAHTWAAAPPHVKEMWLAAWTISDAVNRHDERERCAKLADEYATWGGSNFAAWFTKLAAAIRA